jgi:hypothetical protein
LPPPELELPVELVDGWLATSCVVTGADATDVPEEEPELLEAVVDRATAGVRSAAKTIRLAVFGLPATWRRMRRTLGRDRTLRRRTWLAASTDCLVVFGGLVCRIARRFGGSRSAAARRGDRRERAARHDEYADDRHRAGPCRSHLLEAPARSCSPTGGELGPARAAPGVLALCPSMPVAERLDSTNSAGRCALPGSGAGAGFVAAASLISAGLCELSRSKYSVVL